jgi:hypothetical protein
MSEDGSILLAKIGEDDKEHIEGRMVLCKGDVQKMVLRRLGPLWIATMGINTIVMIPMVRYIAAGCCADSSHVKNRMETDFLTKLRKDLEEFRVNLKRHLHGTGRSQCQVMDPTVDLVQLEERHVWGEDAAHPSALGFDKMVTGIKAMEIRIGERIRAAEARAASKRPRLEATGGQQPQRGRGGGQRPPRSPLDNYGRGSRRTSEEYQGWSRSRRNEWHEGPQYGDYDIMRGGRF